MSAVTNATRGTTGGSRLISNSEILDLLSAAQDNGDGIITLLFATVAELEEPSDRDASLEGHGTGTVDFDSGYGTQPSSNDVNDPVVNAEEARNNPD